LPSGAEPWLSAKADEIRHVAKEATDNIFFKISPFWTRIYC
jgi:hypothetical protein